MSTDTPLCAFVENQVICGYPQADTYGIHGTAVRPSIHRHPFVPPIERTLDDASAGRL